MQAATSLDSERDEKQRMADERVWDPQFVVDGVFGEAANSSCVEQDVYSKMRHEKVPLP